MKNNNYIFACINGMPFSETVCDYSAWLSEKLNHNIKLFHSLDNTSNETEVDLSGNIGFDANDELMNELVTIEHERKKLLQRRGKIILERAKKRVERRGVTDPNICLQHGGMVENLIALREKMEIVIMGRYGQNHITQPEKAIGNRVESAIRSIEKPILVVSQSFQEPKSILLAYDDSENSKKAVQYLLSLSGFKELEIHLVFVGSQTEESTLFLNEATTALKSAGFSARNTHLAGPAESTIVEYINQNDIGIMMMGAFGHHWIRNLLIGSFTSKMLSVSEKPLLLIR